MSNSSVIKEFLVSLGWKIDESGMRRFHGAVDGATGAVAKLGKAMGISVGAVEVGVAVIAARLSDLYYASQRTGATVENIEALQLAARNVGLSASGARGALEGFASALRSNPGMPTWLQAMGVTGKDTSELYRNFIGEMAQKPFWLAKSIAGQFGIDEQTLLQEINNLGAYDRAVAEHRKVVREYGVDEDAAARSSVQYERALAMLQDRFIVLGEKIGIALMPYAQQFLTWLTEAIDWVVKFEEKHHILARAFGAIRDALVDAKTAIQDAFGPATKENLDLWMKVVNDGLTATSDLIRAVIHLLTGDWKAAWNDAANFSGHMKSMVTGAADNIQRNELIASVARSQGKNVAGTAMNFFEAQGWTHAQASGIASNLFSESRFNPRADNGTHYGVAQWDANRQAKFKEWSGHDIRQSSLAEQLAFVQYELTRGSETTAGNLLRQQSDPFGAAVVFGSAYERFGNNPQEAQFRGENAVIINQKTYVNVAGATDPHATGRAVEDAQTRVNGDLVRNTAGALR